MMNQKKVLSLIVIVLMALSCNQQSRNVENDLDKTNILWIVADDLGADLGCYGDSLIYTPNLDRFASEGVKYNNFYTVTAVCSPSRSTMITGMYPVSINCHQHRTQYKDSLPEGIYPVTKYFKDTGYFTSNGDFRDKNRAGKQDYNFKADSIFDGTDWSQRKPGQPFFSQIQVHYPHRAFTRDSLFPVDQNSVHLPPYYPDHKIARQDWALYLETIQILDREVGEILKRLDEEGLADSTVVFFFGDQGRCMVRAKQFMYDGGIHTPLIIRYPGKMHKGDVKNILVSNVDLAPATLALAGIKIPDYMQGTDFLDPDIPEREYVFTMRDRRDETVDRIRAIRTKNFKYIRNFYPERPYTQFNAYKKRQYPVLTLMQIMHREGKLTPVQDRFMKDTKPSEELYDLTSDPWEIHSLAGDKKYSDTLRYFRKLMDSLLLKYDKGIYPEDEEEILYAKELMEQRYKKGMKRMGLNLQPMDEEILEYWKKQLTPTGKKENIR
ncbi:MAG: sulfatase [Bacteroidales bacterium]|nr:sulfatase [Bacteroidales bacterium]